MSDTGPQLPHQLDLTPAPRRRRSRGFWIGLALAAALVLVPLTVAILAIAGVSFGSRVLTVDGSTVRVPRTSWVKWSRDHRRVVIHDPTRLMWFVAVKSGGPLLSPSDALATAFRDCITNPGEAGATAYSEDNPHEVVGTGEFFAAVGMDVQGVRTRRMYLLARRGDRHVTLAAGCVMNLANPGTDSTVRGIVENVSPGPPLTADMPSSRPGARKAYATVEYDGCTLDAPAGWLWYVWPNCRDLEPPDMMGGWLAPWNARVFVTDRGVDPRRAAIADLMAHKSKATYVYLQPFSRPPGQAYDEATGYAIPVYHPHNDIVIRVFHGRTKNCAVVSLMTAGGAHMYAEQTRRMWASLRVP